MASGTGYILSWTIGEEAGTIHVCSGDNLVNNDVAFPFARCSSAVQTILNAKNIDAQRDCPPPAGSLLVSFDFDIQGGMDLAVNVRQ